MIILTRHMLYFHKSVRSEQCVSEGLSGKINWIIFIIIISPNDGFGVRGTEQLDGTDLERDSEITTTDVEHGEGGRPSAVCMMLSWLNDAYRTLPSSIASASFVLCHRAS